MTGERILPNAGLTNRWTDGSDGWGLEMDANLAMLDALLFLKVGSASLLTPPSSPTQGDRYVVGVGASGGWAGKDGNIALWLDGAWTFIPAADNWRAYVADVGFVYRFTLGTGWAKDYIPYDVQIFRYGMPTSPEPVLSLVMSRPIHFPVSLAASRATLKIAPAVTQVFTIYQNVTSIGTINFGAGSVTGTFTFSGAIDFAAGDILEIALPSSVDSTMRGLRVVLVGYR